MIKFVYNNNKHVFTKKSFFVIILNYSSRIFFEKFTNFQIKFTITKQHVKNFEKFIVVFKKKLKFIQKH